MTTAAKLPVHLGDLMGPSGNVYMVIANVKSSIKQLDREGIPVSDEARDIVANFTTRSYDETLDLIAEHCDDLDGSVEDYRNGREFSYGDEFLIPDEVEDADRYR